MRTFSALVKAALSGASVTSRFIVRAYLPGATYAASDSPSDFTWDNGAGALTYRGFDAALVVSLPTMDAQSKINAATLQLSATDPLVLTSLFQEPYRGAQCQIALLIFDPATGVPAEELILVDGLLDVGSITDQPAKATDPGAIQISTLSLTVQPRTVDMKRASGRVASDSDQRLFRDANDGFFKDVALVGISKINWGLAGSASPAQAATNPALGTPGLPGFGGPVFAPGVPGGIP